MMSSTTRLTSAVALLLTTLFTATGYPTGGRAGDRQASWDDVNVVAHGLLQLGQALREHVEKSRAQVKQLNTTLLRLEEQQGMMGHRAGDRGVQELVQRMERLEEVIRKSGLDRSFSDDANLPLVQRLIEKVQQQQDNLEKQSVHLLTLQSKMVHKRMKSLKQRRNELAEKNDGEHKGFAKDCHELFLRGHRRSGVYRVRPQTGQKPFSVLCEMTTEGGWTVIQKRYDGSESFEQTWDSYKSGFGILSGEFWLGLDHIHALTKQGQYVLQTELSDWAKQGHVITSEFRVGGEEAQFSLHLGPASDASSGVPFSTTDRDNDLSAEVNCALEHSGGWWFRSCGDSNLNGEFPSSLGGSRDMFWTTTEGQRTVLRSTVMKMAPVSILQ